MKKIMIAAVTALMIGGVTACGGGDTTVKGAAAPENKSGQVKKTRFTDELEKEIETMRKNLPQDLGDGLTFENVYLRNDCFTMVISYPDSEQFKLEDTPELRATILTEVGSPTLSRLKEAGIGLQYIYRDRKSGKQTAIAFSPDEL
ncbi:MAG: hypothetical protein HDS67_00360 [Bacteroidales bacterium]|nr:hypothetical protein [Bacteroidales bacterium]